MKKLTENLPAFDGWELDIQASYGGSDRKTGLIDPDGNRWMAKYSDREAPRNDLATSYVNNAVSEHVASGILRTLGYRTHETRLGLLDGELVVLCRNFVSPDEALVEFEKFMRRHYDSHDIGKLPDVTQIYEIMEIDPVLAPQAETFTLQYWKMFVADALIGNFDRHKGNFGYLVNSRKQVRMSPIYDNGSALFPRLSEEGMKKVLEDPREIMMRVSLFPNAALTFNGRKTRYYGMMASGLYDELTQAVIDAVPRIRSNFPKALGFINGCDFLSDIRKEFYSVILSARLGLILDAAYERCASGNYDADERKSLLEGIVYSRQDFEADWNRNHAVYEKRIDEIRRFAAAMREKPTPRASRSRPL